MSRLLPMAFALIAACATAPPRVPLDGAWPQAPATYDEAHDTWTRRATLRDGYREVLTVEATLKAPPWRAAHARHVASLRGGSDEALLAAAREADAGGVEVELVVTAWDRAENDLDRGARASWQVALLTDDGAAIAPRTVVRDRRPPSTIRAEYPGLGHFAQAYAVTFPRDVPVFGPTTRRLRLRVSGTQGALELAWDAP